VIREAEENNSPKVGGMILYTSQFEQSFISSPWGESPEISCKETEEAV